MKNIKNILRIAYRKKLLVLSIATLIWIFFGTMIILRAPLEKEKLGVISGELMDWQIIEIPGYRQMIDVLTFNINNNSTKIALFLNSKELYQPLTDKFEKGKLINIMYNDNGHLTKGGYNLHVYEIIYDNKTLFDYSSTLKRDIKLGLILYGVGLLFGLFLIITFLYERKQIKSSS